MNSNKILDFFSNINISYLTNIKHVSTLNNTNSTYTKNSLIRNKKSLILNRNYNNSISNINIALNHNNSLNLNKNSNNKFIKKLFVKLFGTSQNVTNKNILDIDNQLNGQILKGLNNIKEKESTGWIYCSRACEDISLLFKKEIESTLYMLNIISNSLVSINNLSVKFILNGTIEDLDGNWEMDKDKFTFEFFEKPSSNNNPLSNNNTSSNNKTRLIMGFGPSASGKTYCAKAIITMLSENDSSFPKSFLSIDGGIYREKSYIYQKLIGLISFEPYNGLLNLVLSGYHLKRSYTNMTIEERKTLFNSDIIKKKVTEYLIYLKNKHNNKISLYIPETLGGCLINCSSIYKKYIEITDDSESWIGLLIWQHKTHNDCDYKEDYQCKGCTESGQNREKKEGKKYSNRAWENSMLNGRKYMMEAPGGRYEIHNGGGYEYKKKKNNNDKPSFSKSVIIDHSSEKKLKSNNIPKNFKLLNNIKTFNNVKKVKVKTESMLSRLASPYIINIKRRLTV